MTYFDAFNGDADGICALTQLRNAKPRDSVLVTGVKRDISLLSKIEVTAGDSVTVLDISLDKNRGSLERILNAGAEVFYVDHHFSGDIPAHKNLVATINTAADVCTSILVNQHLNGAFTEWAIVGTFGDNLKNSAEILAKPLCLSQEKLGQLENLGIYINYNGYGTELDELHFSPAELYRLVSTYASPFQFIKDSGPNFQKLEIGYQQDMSAAASLEAEQQSDSTAVFILPNEPWARRVSGVYSNDLANDNPSRGHAVLTVKANGNYLVSVRAPLKNKTGADELVRRFPTGGGRKAAAGINDLPADQLSDFIDQFKVFYS